MAGGVRDDRQPGLDLHQPAAPARDLQRQLTRLAHGQPGGLGPRSGASYAVGRVAVRTAESASDSPSASVSLRCAVAPRRASSAGASPSCWGWRRRWRSSTQRPRTPRPRPATSVPSSSVPGVLTAWSAAVGDRQHALAADRPRARPRPRRQAERGQRRRQQHARPASGSRRRGVELVRAEQQRRARRRTPGRGSSRATPSGRPPRATAMVWAAASRRDQVRATCLSGGAIGLTVPRSGQVPTTTATPASREPAHRLGEVAARTPPGSTGG